MTSGQETGGATADLVHTHGTRLVRLAHLLGADKPETTAADAMATTLLQRTRRPGDAHDELLVAAGLVGARGQPPIRGTARLQGWLDRAELDPHDVDISALLSATARRLEEQQGRRSRNRRRAATGVVAAAVVVVATGLLWPGEDPATAGWPVPGSGILYPDRDLNGGDPNADERPQLPARRQVELPAVQRAAANVTLADVVLNGRTIPIMPTTLAGVPANVVGVGCTARGGIPALCVLAIPASDPLADATRDALLTVLTTPRIGHVASDSGPTVLRAPSIDGLTGLSLTVEVTSSDVDAVLVTYTNGSQVLANRYRAPNRPGTLFAALNIDVMPSEVAYLAADGTTLARIALYTATP
ncbi:hypothetical protein BH18ACT8_BH18ACT8_04840 [soil metagenome]